MSAPALPEQGDGRFHRLAKPVARNSGMVFGGRIVGRVLRFLLEIVLGRFLGPARYGLFVLGTSAVAVAQTLGAVGTDRGALRFIAIRLQTPASGGAADVAKLSLLTAGFGGLLGGVALYLIAPLVGGGGSDGLGWVLRLLAPAVPLYALLMVAAGIARGANRIGLDTAIQEIVFPAANLLLVGVGFLVFGADVAVAAVALSVALAITVGFGLWRAQRFVPMRHARRGRALLHSAGRAFWLYSLSLLVIELGQLTIGKLDRLVLGGLLSIEAVGLYAAAATVSRQNTFLLTSINTAFAPRVAVLHDAGEWDDLGYLLKVLNRWTLMTTLPLLIISALLAPELLGLMGPAFREAWPVLVALSVGQLIAVGSGSVGVLLNMSGNQRLELYNMLVSVALLPVLFMALAPTLGILGAGIGLAIIGAGINVARVVEVYATLRLHPFQASTWRILACGAVAAGVWLVVNPFVAGGILVRLAIGSGVVGGTYALCVWGFALESHDRVLLDRLRARVGRRPASGEDRP